MSVNIIQWLGIYPDAIEDAAETAEGAMTEAGCLVADIDGIHSEIAERFRSGELDCSDITNALIAEYFDRAKAAIEEQIKGIDITYYVNCDDSHFYVNGEEYFNGDGIIEELREGIEISYVEQTEYQNVPAVRAVLNIENDDILRDLICGAETTSGYPANQSLAEIYEDEDKDDWDILCMIDKADRLVNFEASALLLQNGKRVYELRVTDFEHNNYEYVVRADRPEQLQNPALLTDNTDMAVRAFDKGNIEDDETLELFEKHISNREKMKEKNYGNKQYD